MFTTVGVPMVEPESQQSPVSGAGLDVHHAFLISERTPLSLLGRDLLQKLHAISNCTPDGVFLTVPHNKALQPVQYLQ